MRRPVQPWRREGAWDEALDARFEGFALGLLSFQSVTPAHGEAHVGVPAACPAAPSASVIPGRVRSHGESRARQARGRLAALLRDARCVVRPGAPPTTPRLGVEPRRRPMAAPVPPPAPPCPHHAPKRDVGEPRGGRNQGEAGWPARLSWRCCDCLRGGVPLRARCTKPYCRRRWPYLGGNAWRASGLAPRAPRWGRFAALAGTHAATEAALSETGEALAQQIAGEPLPLDGIRAIDTHLLRLERHGDLDVAALNEVRTTLAAARVLRRYLAARRSILPALTAACPIDPTLDRLTDQLDQAFDPEARWPTSRAELKRLRTETRNLRAHWWVGSRSRSRSRRSSVGSLLTLRDALRAARRATRTSACTGSCRREPSGSPSSSSRGAGDSGNRLKLARPSRARGDPHPRRALGRGARGDASVRPRRGAPTCRPPRCLREAQVRLDLKRPE